MSNIRYDLDKKEIGRINAKLLNISTAKFEGDWHSCMHTHHYSELFYVVRGKGEFLVGDTRFEVKGDDMVLVNPNIEHTEVSLNANPLEYIVLGIQGLAFSFGQSAETSSHSVYNCSSHRNEMLFYLNTMLKEIAQKKDQYETIYQDLLEVLLITLMRHTNYNLALVSSSKPSKECAAAKRYLDENFKNSITLDELAEITHMNKYYLIHSFRKTYGISPINYLIERRVNESKILLETTNLSLSQISQIIGFSSPSYFSQTFKKWAAESPIEYRKRHQVAIDSTSKEII